ncbi:glycosyltransferase [Thermodesulfobacteriota bacterium B35]
MPRYIIILSETASFPWGMAAANRVRNLARGLLQEGWQVEYIGMRGADINKKKEVAYPLKGMVDHIPFQYPGMFAVRPKNWWLRRVDDLGGSCMSIALLLWRKIFRRVDGVLLYTRNPNYAGFLVSFLHLLNIPVILEVCEWPLAVAEVQGNAPEKARRFCEEIVPRVDGVLPISNYIEKVIAQASRRKGKTIPSFKIPILIDVQEDVPCNIQSGNEKYMLYCGAASYMDIARLVVDITRELKVNGTELPVKFTGKKNNALLAALKKYADQQGVLHLLEFTGFVEEEELHRLMRGAVCLLAPLPENIQSESRFPTKIGYYLASGTPVVTNNVGEVARYLQDGKTAFVSRHCDPKQFACNIRQILKHPDFAQRIGFAGRRLAFGKFHYCRACKGLGEFLEQIVEKFRTSL